MSKGEAKDGEILPASPSAELTEGVRRAFNRAFPRSAPFRPGQSGNPGGKSRFYHATRKLFQRHAPELAENLVRLAFTAEDERVRSVCLLGALDRAGIRPIDYDPNSLANEQSRLDVTKLTPEEREVLRRVLTKAAS